MSYKMWIGQWNKWLDLISFSQIATYTGIASTLIPIIMLFYVNKAHSRLWWALLLISCLWLTSDLVTVVFSWFGYNTFVVFNTYDLLSTVLFILVYKNVLKSPLTNKLLNILIPVYVISYISLFFFIGDWFAPNTVCALMTMFIPITLSILYFYQLLSDQEIRKLYEHSFFWINSAVLIHFGMAFFVIGFHDLFFLNSKLTSWLWPILMISNVFYNLILTVGVWRMRQT